MGETNVTLLTKKKDVQECVRRLLRDTQTLERMLYENVFETDPIRIGAEQEFNLIDKNYKPACLNLEVLEKINNPLFTTELARFNLECNLDPQLFEGACLRKMENQIVGLLEEVRVIAQSFETDIILMGILPTIRKSDVSMENITPIDRYKALMMAILELRGEGSMSLNIKGIDELITRHSSPMVEAANTGFQVHLQVAPDDFPNKYNIAQAIAGPAMASATNSPLLFGKRLWKETRIALFQQAVDTRAARYNLRDRSPRVMFGTDWVKKSIIEIYKEDIMRFRVIMSSNEKADSMEQYLNGEMPGLKSLQVHNSTVYRWNRPCYGVANNVPHLRIENRVLPAGPTVLDEMANAALWLGLLNGLGDHYKDITQVMDFDDAKNNFFKVCRNGMDATFTWVNDKKISARELLQKELMPIAKEGLQKQNIDQADIDRYFEVLEERVETRQTGAQWMLNSFSKLAKKTSKDEAIIAITAATLKNQTEEKPVHTWELASTSDIEGSEYSALTVETFMTTDLFTVREDDIIDLAAEMIHAKHIRYIPVEDESGRLLGLLTASKLFKHFNRTQFWKADEMVLVKDVMIKKPITIHPKTPISDALELMQKHNMGSLPVVEGPENMLVGIITEQDFLKITGRLLKRLKK